MKKYVIRFGYNNYFTGFYKHQGTQYPCESWNNGKPPMKFSKKETAEKYLKEIRAADYYGDIIEIDMMKKLDYKGD